MFQRQCRMLSIAAVLMVSSAGTALSQSAPSLDPERGVMTLAPLFERTTPAIVNISVSHRVPIQPGFSI